MNQQHISMHKSLVLENLDQFRINWRSPVTKLMRSPLDMFLLWQIVKHFQPRSFLEIGFAAGQTMGIMYEASQASGQYMSVDIEYDYPRLHIFESIFPSHNISLHETDSKNIVFDADQKFDFIHIDGDHSYQGVINDLKKTWSLMHEQTILYMDDHLLPEVDLAIRNEILARSDFRPFLCGDNSVFFHHRSQNKSNFVDYHIQQKSCNFIYYINEELYDTLVLHARLPNVFVDHTQIFMDTLKAYNL